VKALVNSYKHINSKHQLKIPFNSMILKYKYITITIIIIIITIIIITAQVKLN